MDLQMLWFWIVAFLFVGYFILDGFDFGVGMSMPFIGKSDTDRRQMINSIGPVWDLNETWVIVAGACLFAAFPEWYATLFSGFYLPLLLILLALIVRGVSFEYRHQRQGQKWKAGFDQMIFWGSVIPALLWGVAFGNIVNGVPLDADHNFTGTFFSLLNPYSLLAGLTTLLLFFTHGNYFIALKTEGEVRTRARALALKSGIVTVVVAASFLIWTMVLHGTVFSITLSIVAALALVFSVVANWFSREGWAFGAMAVTIGAAVLSLFASLFPAVMPASNNPAYSLTIENASSSAYTLEFMSWLALIALPLILLYQGWTYWVFRKRVTVSQITAAAH